MRPILDRLGGPDAVSWPLFWVMFVVGALSLFGFPQPYVPLPVRVLSIIPAQLVMFLPLLALRWFLRRDDSRTHPWLVLIGYTVAIVMRAALLTTLLRASDGSITVPFFESFLGDLGLVVIMVVTTLIVSTSRMHARDMERLLLVQRQNVETTEALERQIVEQNDAALASVQRTLSTALVQLERAKDDAARLQALHHLASDVVRPLSHELAQAVPTWTPQNLGVTNTRVDWRQVFTQISSHGPFRPFVTATVIVVMGVFTSLVYLQDKAVTFLIALLLGTSVGLWCANVALDRLLPRPNLRTSVGIVLLGAVLGSALPGALAAGIIGGAPGLFLGIFGSLILAGAALLVALVPVVLHSQRQTAIELAASNDALLVSLVRLRIAQWFHQRALARALHGAMQSAVLAAAYRLEAAREEGAITPVLLEEVRADLARSVDVLSTSAEPPMELDAFAAQLTQVWSRVALVNVEATPEAASALNTDPILRAIVIEVASEAMSNAIRHGGATSIDLTMHCPDLSEVTLKVTSDGHSDRGRGGSGLGSRLLDECSLAWQESATDSHRVLLARFPVSTPALTSI